ncbi:MAG: hypothetical protein HYS09_05400 [Chloroflexi bacterium]|nr:hypothetical protein [Chloroflexota bacterium]
MQDASRTRFRILVVDPEPDSRAEVQNLLVQSRHIVVGGMDYGDETVSLAREFAPEVVLVSVADPTDAALEAIRTAGPPLPPP